MQKLTQFLRRSFGKKSPGFTLIEVVIVLAIAGLIFVIIFLAVSQAQASRRDTQRKSDLNRVGGLLEQYASNNSGDFPTGAQFTAGTGAWFADYWSNANFKDPSTGSDYPRASGAPSCDTDADGTVGYVLSGRTYTITMCLEKGEYSASNQ